MLDDLTFEEWHGHLEAFRQEPWDEQRKDDRNAVAAIWSVSPYLEPDTEMPGFVGPEYSNTKSDDLEAGMKRLEATKAKYLSGQLNRKTRNPADH